MSKKLIKRKRKAKERKWRSNVWKSIDVVFNKDDDGAK